MGGTQLAGRTYRAVVDVEDLWWGSIPTIRFTHLTEASELPLSLGRTKVGGQAGKQPTAHGPRPSPEGGCGVSGLGARAPMNRHFTITVLSNNSLWGTCNLWHSRTMNMGVNTHSNQ